MGKPKKGSRGRRRSQAEDMTGAKENAVEVRTPGVGDNSNLGLPAPDDWSHHKKTIAGWREKLTTAQGHLRNAIKQAKKAGINMEALNDVVAIERDNDPAKAMAYFRQLGLGLELSESTLRVTAHDTLAGDEKELVKRRGFEDGKAGRPPGNDYPEASDLAELYSEGWREGQAEIFDIQQSDKKPELEAAE